MWQCSSANVVTGLMIEHPFYLPDVSCDEVVRLVNTSASGYDAPVAERGLRAYAVPSARAGQQPDPAARRDAIAGLVTGGFLAAIFAIVLAIVVAAPQYAEPAPAGALVATASSEPVGEDEREATAAETEVMTSDPPTELTGYRWPVRGGIVHTYYERDTQGLVKVGGEPVHDGLLITWTVGAKVKAAHAGEVVAAGRDWIEHIGYEGPVGKVVKRFDRRAKKDARKSGSRRERFPEGVVIKDGNGYHSVYSELQNLRVGVGDVVKAGQVIGEMSRAEGKQMMRYRLVRMDGPRMTSSKRARQLGYPGSVRERIDPLAVLNLDAKRMPRVKQPRNPPRFSEY